MVYLQSDQGAPGPFIQDESQPVLEKFFPVERMQILQDLFAHANHIGMVITDLEGNWITRMSNASSLCQALQASPTVRERCDITYRVINETVRVSGAPSWQECMNCGFLEAGIPIMAGGRHVANCLVGQTNALNVSRQRVEEYAWSMDVDVLQVRNTYSSMSRLPVDQFLKSLELFSAYATEVIEQTFRSHQLETEVNRMQKVETTLRQESLELVRASAELRESVNRVAHELQDVLRSVGELTDEYDRLKPQLTEEMTQQQMANLVQKIRRAYRTVLDGMAMEQAQRTEMEKVLVGNTPGRLRRLNLRTGSLVRDLSGQVASQTIESEAKNDL
jgi:ligand-binding sensor protein